MKCTHEYPVPKIALAIDGRFPPHVTRLMEACGGQTHTLITAGAILEANRGDPCTTPAESIRTVGDQRAGWVTMRTEFDSTHALASTRLRGFASHA